MKRMMSSIYSANGLLMASKIGAIVGFSGAMIGVGSSYNELCGPAYNCFDEEDGILSRNYQLSDVPETLVTSTLLGCAAGPLLIQGSPLLLLGGLVGFSNRCD